MIDKVLAAVQHGPGQLELTSFPKPVTGYDDRSNGFPLTYTIETLCGERPYNGRVIHAAILPEH